MKKLISVFIVLCVAFVSMPIVLASANVYKEWEYSESAEFITIEKYNGSAVNVTVPSNINGNENVVAIASNAFAENKTIKSVNIPDTVSYIYDRAFYGCENLVNIKAHNYITFGKQVFEGTAFYNDETNWNDGILCFYDSVVKAKTNIQTVTFNLDVHTLCAEAFKDCVKLTSVKIPSSIYSVDEKAFDGCVNLKEVIFERESTEESNINIGKDAFLNCDSLKSVKLPENVSSVSSNAFGFSFNENYVKNEDFVVYGAKETPAENYANSNEFKFVVYDFEKGVVDAENCDHVIVIKNIKNATYFAKGYSGDKVCIECGVVLEKGKATAKLVLKVPSFKLTKGKKQFKVKYIKVKDANGFQVRYKIKGNWKSKSFDSKKTETKTIKGLKKGNYQVQIRAMIMQGSKKTYSAWSKSQKVKVK